MVVIINGEIVPDSDPRAQKAKQAYQRPAATARGGGINTIGEGEGASNSSSSKAFQGAAYTMKEGAYKPPGSASTPSSSSASAALGPPVTLIDKASEALGIRGQTVTIPPLPFLGLSATTVDLLPVLIVALGLLYFGVRGLIAAVVMYIILKRNQDIPPRAPRSRPSGAPAEPAVGGGR